MVQPKVQGISWWKHTLGSISNEFIYTKLNSIEEVMREKKINQTPANEKTSINTQTLCIQFKDQSIRIFIDHLNAFEMSDMSSLYVWCKRYERFNWMAEKQPIMSVAEMRSWEALHISRHHLFIIHANNVQRFVSNNMLEKLIAVLTTNTSIKTKYWLTTHGHRSSSIEGANGSQSGTNAIHSVHIISFLDMNSVWVHPFIIDTRTHTPRKRYGIFRKRNKSVLNQTKQKKTNNQHAILSSPTTYTP